MATGTPQHFLPFLLLLNISFATPNNAETRIGATLPLTGNLASYGENIRRGIQFAVDDVVAEKKKVILTFEDTPLSGSQVLTIFNKLIATNKIQALAGNFSNVGMLTLAPELARTQTIAFHTAAVDDDILTVSKGWIFSTNTRIRDEAKMVAQYAYEKLGARTAGIITIENNFGLSYENYFAKEFASLGGKVVVQEHYQLGETDYKAQVTRIRSAKPEVLFAATFGHFLGLTLKQLRETGATIPVLSVYESEDDSVIQAAHEAAEGLRYFVSYAPAQSKTAKDFFNRYQEKYGTSPGTFTLDAYDAAKILITALDECSGEHACAQKKLHAIKDYDGVSGTLTIEEDGASRKKFYLKEIRGKKFKFVD